MLLFAFFISVVSSQEAPLFSDDFLNEFIKWTPQNETAFHISPCPIRVNKNCLEIKEKNSNLHSNPINTQGQHVIVEFKYLTRASKQRGLFSNLVAGFTDVNQSGYCWYGLGINENHPMYQVVTQRNISACKDMETIVIQDLADGWKDIRFVIPAKYVNNSQLVLVFRDHGHYGDPSMNMEEGAYFITDVVVSVSGKCALGCSNCTTYFDCSDCDDGFDLLERKCYQVSCGVALTKFVPYDARFFSDSITSSIYSAKITIPDYLMDTCWPQQWVTLDQKNGRFTEIPFKKELTSASISISLQDLTQRYQCDRLGEANIFNCRFHFNVHHNEQILFEYNYTKTLDFSGLKAPLVFDRNPFKYVPPLLIRVESDIEYCDKNIDNCEWKRTGEKLTLVLNQRFKIKVKVKDENLKQRRLEPGSIKLSGNGTLVSLDILKYENSIPGQIIYTTALKIRAYKGVNIDVQCLVSGLASNRALTAVEVKEEVKDRRILQERVSTQYTSSKISNISVQISKLVIEENPESGIMYGICLLLILLLF